MSKASAELEALAPEPQPLYLRCAADWAFAFVHPPAGTRARAPAVLLCDTFGCDRMLLHLTYRHLALRLSALGFWVMRVDYPGTCDAGGTPRSAGQWENFKDTLHRSADALREWSGAEEVVLFGALLGGSLAAVVASERSDIAGLVAWGPYVHGRVFFREQQALSAMHQGRQPAGADANEGDSEALGFLVTKEFEVALKGLDLQTLRLDHVPRTCIMPRKADSGEDTLVESCKSGGRDVCEHSAPLFQYERLFVLDAPLPGPVIDHTLEWMTDRFPERPLAVRALVLDEQRARSSMVDCASEGVALRDRPVRFGEFPKMYGVVTEPQTHEEHHDELPTIVLVNGGNNHRVGINRNATEWSRRWAALGFRVLRFDIRGLGDSPPAHPSALNVLYREKTRVDLREALDHLEHAHGHRRFVLMGLCAGGYQAHTHALGDPRVAGVVMLNPLRLSRLPRLRESFRRCFPRGDRLAILRDAGLRERVRDVSRGAAGLIALRSSRPHRDSVANGFLQLVNRGTRVLLVFHEGEPMLEHLDRVLRPDRARLEAEGRFRVLALAGSNHILSPLRTQGELSGILTDFLRVHFAPSA